MGPARDPLRVVSADGTPIAVFVSGDGPPLVLVHGATADHTTFRAVGPLLAPDFRLFALDRRGRGASGDGPDYAIEREFEDVAAVAETVAADAGGPVTVVGHSFGGRCALGAALLTEAVGRVVCYEGAPSPPRLAYQPAGLAARLRADLERGDPAAALARFMTEVVGMPAADLARFRADPVWTARVAAAHTILRELEVEVAPAASLDALGAIRQPVLQVLGGDSPEPFHVATRALDARLADGRVLTIDGARHAAHHTHPVVFAEAVAAFARE